MYKNLYTSVLKVKRKEVKRGRKRKGRRPIDERKSKWRK